MIDDSEEPDYLQLREDSLQGVQRLIMSFLVVAISLFPIGGLLFGSKSLLDDDRLGPGIGMCVMAGLTGVGAIAGTRAIFGQSPWSPVLLAGLIPALIGAFFLF